MIEDLEKLINFIQSEYNNITDKWENSINYKKINLKSNLVCDLIDNKENFNSIIQYRDFINENIIQLIMDFKQFNNENSKVNIRAKAKNSIEYKMENYIKNHENGRIPINKCFNDLFGIRIICGIELTKEQIMKLQQIIMRLRI